MKAVSSFSAVRRWLGAYPLLGLAFLFPSLASAMDMVNKPAFHQDIAFPSGASPGATLGRFDIHLTPNELCGADTCELYRILLFDTSGHANFGDTQVRTRVQGISTRLFINGVQQATTWDRNPFPTLLTFSDQLHLEVQLFRNELPFREGSLQDGTCSMCIRSPMYFAVYARRVTVNGVPGASGPQTNILLEGNIRGIQGSCHVTDQTVHLPTIMPSQLKGKGVALDTAQRDFDVQINGCPAGFNNIHYLFEPKGGPIAGMAGTLPLITGSTASGVGILIRKGDTAVALRQRQRLDSYNTNLGGSYTLPLNATYVQTGSQQAGVGTVKAAMEIWLDYD